MIIPIASDHAGYQLKEKIKKMIKEMGHHVVDLGCFNDEKSVDYPDYGKEVALSVSRGESDRGVLICGTGIGMSIVANKFPKIRAALCHNVYTALTSREHNDANILVLGARVLDWESAKEIVQVWFSTEFAGERHEGRVNKITEVEKERFGDKYEVEQVECCCCSDTGIEKAFE
ncbi:MAG: ribose 5-phosphate isomerase B [Bacillota bacterium]|jgi:RpiB/LacA/LacB family sugar-phosphate isomerase